MGHHTAAWSVYQRQLGNTHKLGHPLWHPELPSDLPVQIGDVGWIYEGEFIPFFNVLRKDHERNLQLDESGNVMLPEGFEELRYNRTVMHRKIDSGQPKGIYISTGITGYNAQGSLGASTLLNIGVEGTLKVRCNKKQGAFLCLKDDADVEKVIPSREFHGYVAKHVDAWYEFVKKIGVDGKAMKLHDLVLISGTVKTSAWALAAFIDKSKEYELSVNAPVGPFIQAGAGGGFHHAVTATTPIREGPQGRQTVIIGQTSSNMKAPELPRDQTVFLRYYKVRVRFLGLTRIMANSSEPSSDSSDGDGSDTSQPGGTREVEMVPPLDTDSDFSHLDDVLDYILEHSDAELAIASTGDVEELCEGQWPNDMGAYLAERKPKIDTIVDRDVKKAFLSISDIIIQRNAVRFIQDTDLPMDPQQQGQGGDEGDSADPEARSKKPLFPDELKSGTLFVSRDSFDWPHLVLMEDEEGGAVNTMVVTHDGRYIVSGHDDGVIRLWDPHRDNENLVRKLEGHDDGPWALAISQDGTKLVSCSAPYQGILWDLADINEPQLIPLEGHTGNVQTVAISPDGTKAATGSVDQTARLWNTETGENYATLMDHEASVHHVLFSPDSRIIASATDPTIHIWDADTGDSLRVLRGHDGIVWNIAFAPNGARIMSGSDDNTVRIWDVQSGDELVVIREQSGPIVWVSFSPDGQEVVSGSSDASVAIYDSYTGACRHLLKDNPASPVYSVAYSPNGEFVVAGCSDGIVKLWESGSGMRIAALEGHKDSVKTVDFTPRGDSIVSAADDGTVRVWGMADIFMVA